MISGGLRWLKMIGGQSEYPYDWGGLVTSGMVGDDKRGLEWQRTIGGQTYLE